MTQVIELGGRRLALQAHLGGDLYRVEDISSHCPFMLKVIQQPDSQLSNALRQEIQALRELNPHPGFITLHAAKQTPSVVLCLYDFCSLGSLDEGLDVDPVRMLSSVAEALLHMHRRPLPLIHRNLNSRTVFVTADSQFKVSGLEGSTECGHVSELDLLCIQAQVSRLCSSEWLAPELLELDVSLIGTKADIWSLGCLFYFALFRSLPFADRKTQYGGVYTLPKDVPGKFKELLQIMLEPNPMKRTDVQGVLDKLGEQSVSPTVLSTKASTFFQSRNSTALLALKCVKNTPKPANRKHIELLIGKAKAKPTRISKLYKTLLAVDNLSSPQVNLKLIYLLLVALQKGPQTVLQESPSILDVLTNVESCCSVRPNNPFRSEFFYNLTRIFTSVLKEKCALMRNYGFTGSFSRGDSEISELRAGADLLNFWRSLLQLQEHLILEGTLKALRNHYCEQVILEQAALMDFLNSFLSVWRTNSLLTLFQECYARAAEVSSLLGRELPTYSLPPPETYYATAEETKENAPVCKNLVDIELIDLTSESVTRYTDAVNKGLCDWQLNMTEVQTLQKVSSGGTCEVFLGFYRKTPVALKLIKTQAKEKSGLKAFSREVAVLVKMRHPNLVLFMGAYLGEPLCIATEFCAGGDLFHLLHQKKEVFLSWEQKLSLLKDIARGMHFLHSHNIIHRDLKSLNLFLTNPVKRPTDPVQVKVGDFGLARIVRHESMMTGQLGTCHWMAPEVLLNQNYSLKADVYSFSVRPMQIVLWEVIMRETPFKGIPVSGIRYRVLNYKERPDTTHMPPSCPENLVKLMYSCWRTNPEKRPTFCQVLDYLDKIQL